MPSQVLPVELWAKAYEEIDVFNWQDAVKDMLSASELEVRLAASEGRIRTAIERGTLEPDHALQLGERIYYFFRSERVEEIRERLGLPSVGDTNIRELFLEFTRQMDMTTSYKPVMLDALLRCVNEEGRAAISEVVNLFREFYLRRARRGEPVERSNAKMAQASRMSTEEIRALLLSKPFEKFERRGFMSYDRQDLAFIRIDRRLWRQLTEQDIEAIRTSCHEAIERYFRNLSAS